MYNYAQPNFVRLHTYYQGSVQVIKGVVEMYM
jgi:hypothetical protein